MAQDKNRARSCSPIIAVTFALAGLSLAKDHMGFSKVVTCQGDGKWGH